jgi:hypothetical protein
MTTTSGWATTRRLENSAAKSKVLEHFPETSVPGLDGKSPMRSLSVVDVWVFEFRASHCQSGNYYLKLNVSFVTPPPVMIASQKLPSGLH